jgi:predicted flap endonuclease-1-like 5' DNA nuclease
MSGFLWLISEMLLLLTLVAVVFFILGWRWRARRSRIQTLILESRLDDEAQAAKLAREERDAARLLPNTPPSLDPAPDSDIAALAAELSETQSRQLCLERELLRLRDAKLAVESEFQAFRAATENALPQSATAPDDLTQLRGVGSVMSAKLHAAGIHTFRQLARLSESELAALDQSLKLQGRASRERWQQQAQSLHLETHGSPP